MAAIASITMSVTAIIGLRSISKVPTNRDGIGIVRVTAGGVTQMRVQDGGVHHRSQNHQRMHLGWRIRRSTNPNSLAERCGAVSGQG